MSQPVRSIGSLSLRMSMLTIPLKLYTAQSEKKISFNRIVEKTGARVQQLLIDASTSKPIVGEVVEGYEFTPGEFVTFTKAELKAIEAEGRPDELRIREAVPLASVDSRHIGKATYLGANKGGERAFSLLATVLRRQGVALIGQRGTRTRDDLILVREEACGLVMHELLYADEVRAITDTAPVAFQHSEKELGLADRLIVDHLQRTFNAARFVDGGAARVQRAVDRKRRREEIVVPPEKDGDVAGDLLEQLERSIGQGPKKARSIAPASEVRGKKSTRERAAR